MLGDTGVGKTSLVTRLVHPEASQNPSIPATMGIEFETSLVPVASTSGGVRQVKAQLWDTAGQERFSRVLLPTYFRKARGVVLVFDLHDEGTLKSIEGRWMEQLREHASDPGIARVMVGNKRDLGAGCEAEAKATAERLGVKLFLASAREGGGVEEAFRELLGEVHERAWKGEGEENFNGGVIKIAAGGKKVASGVCC